MANEAVKKRGSWVLLNAAASLVTDTFLQGSTSTMDTLLNAGEEVYFGFEMRVDLSGLAAVENDSIEVHLRLGDGTTLESPPSGNFAPHPVGSITLDDPLAFYFSSEMPILSPDAQIYLKSNATNTLTAAIHIRAVTPVAAA